MIYGLKVTSDGFMTTHLPYILTGEMGSLMTLVKAKTVWLYGEAMY